MTDLVNLPSMPRTADSSPWTRRNWLVTNAAALAAAHGGGFRWTRGDATVSRATMASRTEDGLRLTDVAQWESLAQHAVDAAKAAGASYADARLTRTVQHLYHFSAPAANYFGGDIEIVGVGVRALVNGYWGFAAAPRADVEHVTQLARDAVAQAKVNALGTTRPVMLAPAPAARGHWATPMRIDPFSVSIEEKNDYIRSWLDHATRVDAAIDRIRSGLQFARQERTVATSDGALFTQRLYESSGRIICTRIDNGNIHSLSLDGLQAAGKGWELFLDANIPDQLTQMRDRLNADSALRAQARPITIGRYTIVCDGAAMASLVDQTLGFATQLDRALGYEANASGTSFLSDPLAMLGTAVAAPSVTITSNRTAAAQLGTVKWDDEGVAPRETTLIKDGTLTDFQTTREQAAWLAPYYQKSGRAISSQGCAGAENALFITLQHCPNLALASGTAATTVDDLIANVTSGIFVSGGEASSDFQARNGTLLGSTFRKITNGRLGPMLTGGAVQFNAPELWRQVAVVAGERTRQSIASSQYPFGSMVAMYGYTSNIKGQPPQMTGHTVTAPAATITGQAIIDPSRKA